MQLNSLISLVIALLFCLSFRMGVLKLSFNWGYVYKAARFVRAAFTKMIERFLHMASTIIYR